MTTRLPPASARPVPMSATPFGGCLSGKPYDRDLKSKVADVNHISNSAFAGSITAALFLKRFVKNASRYAHLDIYGWVNCSAPGKPAGGEPQGARALFEIIRNEFGRLAP